MDDNDATQNEATMAAQARMFAPLIWTKNSDFEIQSLKDENYNDALNLIKHHYLKEEPMCASIVISEDRNSVKRFLEMALTWMKDTLSICALSAQTGRLVGVAVIRINSLNDKSEIYDRIQVLNGDALPKIMQLRGALVKQAKIYEALDTEEYLKIYILSVHPSYESRGVRSGLIEAAFSVSRSLKIPPIFAIFTSKLEQEVAQSLDLKIFSEIQYSRWIINDEVIFDDPGIGNYSAALMGVLVPVEEPGEQQNKRKQNTMKKVKYEKKEHIHRHQ